MDTDEYVGPVLDLRNNGRKKLLFVGKTGAGKSALCNALSVPMDETSEFQECTFFPESGKSNIGNTATLLSNVHFLGQPQKKVSFIDTVGFDSTEKKTSEVAEFIVKLKENCDHINLIAVVLDNPKRLEESLKNTIELLDGMFGKDKFWENVVFLISNLKQSEEEINNRSKRGNSDKERISNFWYTLKKTFTVKGSIHPPFLIMDAHFNMSDDYERRRFKDSAEKLYKMLMDKNREKIPLTDIKKVVDKYEGLEAAMKKEKQKNDNLKTKVTELRAEKEKNLRMIEEAKLAQKNETTPKEKKQLEEKIRKLQKRNNILEVGLIVLAVGGTVAFGGGAVYLATGAITNIATAATATAAAAAETAAAATAAATAAAETISVSGLIPVLTKIGISVGTEVAALALRIFVRN